MSSKPSNLFTATPEEDMVNMKGRSLRGGGIVMTSQAITLFLQIASTFFLARLLTPDDYGVSSMVLVVTGFAGMFRDMGLSTATVQAGVIEHSQISNIFWLNVSIGATLSSIVYLIAPLVGKFYGSNELIDVTRLLSLTFIFGSIGAQHQALLQRGMRFGSIAISTVSGLTVNLMLATILAANGYGYWSLAWGNLMGVLVTSLILFGLSGFRPSLWNSNISIRNVLGFGANITLFEILNYFHRNLDKLLIGRYLGAESLGVYSRSYSLLMLPVSGLRNPITGVGFPALSRLVDNPQMYSSYFYKLTNILALTSMPLAAFLFCASEAVIQQALGDQWVGAVPIFSVLALVAFVQPVQTLWGISCLSRGMGRRYLHLGIVNTFFCVAAFIIGLNWGALGVAVGYALVTYITGIPILLMAFSNTPLEISHFLKSAARPFIASILAASSIRILYFIELLSSSIISLLVAGVIFMIIYLISLRMVPGGAKEIRTIVRIFTFLTGRLKLK